MASGRLGFRFKSEVRIIARVWTYTCQWKFAAQMAGDDFGNLTFSTDHLPQSPEDEITQDADAPLPEIGETSEAQEEGEEESPIENDEIINANDKGDSGNDSLTRTRSRTPPRDHAGGLHDLDGEGPDGDGSDGSTGSSSTSRRTFSIPLEDEDISDLSEYERPDVLVATGVSYPPGVAHYPRHNAEKCCCCLYVITCLCCGHPIRRMKPPSERLNTHGSWSQNGLHLLRIPLHAQQSCCCCNYVGTCPCCARPIRRVKHLIEHHRAHMDH